MSVSNEVTKTYDVAVIGCGLMGSALAKGFAANGLRVAAWNRTPERANVLAGNGITAVHDVSEAVRSSRLVVGCTSTYDTTLSSLEPVADWQGTALVNVGTGSPDDAEKAGRWAAERGARYLDGSILCFPQQIGTAEGSILFSGEPSVWAEHERALMSLGEASGYVSDQVKGAAVIESSLTGAFYVAAMSAYVEAVTYALSQGISAEALRAVTAPVLDIMRSTTDEAIAAIESDNHQTDSATLEVYAEGSRTCLAVMRAAGHRTRVLGGAVENLNAAEAAGLGKLGFYAQTKITRTDA